MIIVRLKGGLGNQMFQYALGRVLSMKNGVELGYDISFYKTAYNPKREYDLPVFNVAGRVLDEKEIPFIHRISGKSRLLNKIIRHQGKEKFFQFDVKVVGLKDGVYLNGYWQSPKYFKGYEKTIRKDFTLKNPLTQNIQNLAKEISNTSSLAIHARRGDYVGNTFHEIVTKEYYERGIKYISGKTTIEKIYVFSDDINWCKDNLKFEFPTMFVDGEYAGEKGEGHMFLMSECKNFIIANSSFSWWAAWLAPYPDKIVVAPKQWFPDTSINTDDLIPEEWEKI